MIKVLNVNKTIDKSPILKNCSMNVPKGSIYGLVGPNGAGKSTIIRHIVGSIKADSGDILIEDESVYENPNAKSKIAYIPDDVFFHVTDNITSLMKFYKGLYKGFDNERFEKLLPLFPALNKKKLIRSYSKGMQRQAAFLLSLCLHPSVMILDEPLDGLDPIMRRQILGIIVSEVTNAKMTVLISSHNLRELEDICDHVGIMDKGSVVIERTLSDLQATVSKIQIALEEDKKLPEGLDILHSTSIGRVKTIIVRGDKEKIVESISSVKPLLLDVLPLTLEEIFIYEMGGAGNEFEQALF